MFFRSQVAPPVVAPRSKARFIVIPLAAAALIGFATFIQAQTMPVPSPSPSPAPVTGVVPPGGAFFTGALTAAHWRSAEIIGAPVYNMGNERIGDVEQLLFDSDGRAVAAILGVGGFLGMGERRVAVNYRSMVMSRDSAGKGRIVVDVSKAALQAAPVFATTRI